MLLGLIALVNTQSQQTMNKLKSAGAVFHMYEAGLVGLVTFRPHGQIRLRKGRIWPNLERNNITIVALASISRNNGQGNSQVIRFCVLLCTSARGNSKPRFK